MSYNEYDREEESYGEGRHRSGREQERNTGGQEPNLYGDNESGGYGQPKHHGGKKHHGEDYEEGNVETGGYDRRSGLQSRDEYQPSSRDEYTGGNPNSHSHSRRDEEGEYGSRGRFSGGAGNTYTEYRSPERGEEKPNADLYGGESGTYGEGSHGSHHKPAGGHTGGGDAAAEFYEGGSTRGNYGGRGPTYNSNPNQNSHDYDDGGSTRGNYGGQGPRYDLSGNQGSKEYDGGSSRGNYDGQGPSYNQSSSGKSSGAGSGVNDAYVQGSGEKWKPGQKMSFPATEAGTEKKPFNDSGVQAAGQTQDLAKEGLELLENWAKNEVKEYLSGDKRH